LTPFLSTFIPGRAEHALKVKESYQHQGPIILSSGAASRKLKWEKKPFEWGQGQEEAFQYVKDCIAQNSMTGADPKKQYHIVADASLRGIGGFIFQLNGQPREPKRQRDSDDSNYNDNKS
jgi:hypothetical protein